jgi:hypothetical protein
MWILPIFRAMERRRRSHLRAVIALAALVAPAVSAAPEEIVLRPRYQAGDRYALALSTETKTRVDARGTSRNAFREEVELRYAAQVEVLETDGAGVPIRERHEGVDLTYVRPEGTQSLFTKGASFELTRRTDGTVEIRFRGERVGAKIEKIVGDLLAHQTEYAIAALLDPGRPVAVGERWELEPERVRDFLRTRGIEAVKLDGAATAELGAGKGDQLALHYRIPIGGFSLPDLPPGANPRGSEGNLDGEVQLDARGFHRARAHSSALALRFDGSLHNPGTARAASWRLRRSQSVNQHTEMLKDQLASSR